MYTHRKYRDWSGKSKLIKFDVVCGQSDLQIQCVTDKKQEAERLLGRVRRQIETYIKKDSKFETALVPIVIKSDASDVVKKMGNAADAWNVGPMASVAGAVAEYVGAGLAEYSEEVIVENGGDLFARTLVPVKFAIYAGEKSPFSDKLVFELDSGSGIGICTSSGIVGPSLSLGKADAVVAISKDVAFADAAATSVANRIGKPADVERVVNEEQERGILEGLIVCCEDRLGLFGAMKLIDG